MSDSAAELYRRDRGYGCGTRMLAARLVAAMAALLLASVAGAQWEKEVKLSATAGAASLNENMGRCVIADGNAVHAVWAEHKTQAPGIYYRRSDDKGATWGSAVLVSGKPNADTFPLVALSGSTLHVSFLRGFGTAKAESFYTRSTDGGKTWGPELSLGQTKWWPGVAASGDMVYVSLNTVFADEPANSVVYFRRSKDNGATWEPQVQISNAPRRAKGRAEDPAIMASGKYVHLVWNDNRDADPGKGMAVYHRRSEDMGATFGPETALTHAPEYTYFPTIALAGPTADIAHGDRQTGSYNIYFMHSADFGATWGKKQQLTKSTTGEGYPALAIDGANVHLVWSGIAAGVSYLHSGDGGATWDPPVRLAEKGGSPFIAVAGEAVHVIFTSQRGAPGQLSYLRNPTGNKPAPAPTPQPGPPAKS